MKWTRVETYADLVVAAGAGAIAIRTWYGDHWSHEAQDKVSARQKRNAIKGYRIGAETEVFRLPSDTEEATP